jgi:hypothetical protein
MCGFFLGVGVAHLDGLRSNLDGAVSDHFLVLGVYGCAGYDVFVHLVSHYGRCGMGNMADMANMAVRQGGVMGQGGVVDERGGSMA